MVYNNGFPMGFNYQQPVQTGGYMPQPQPQQVTAQYMYIPVNSEDEVNRYEMAPNTAVLMIDIPHQTTYAKSCDAFGRCKTVIFDMIERTDAQEDGRYVTKEEFEEFRKQMTEVRTNE